MNRAELIELDWHHYEHGFATEKIVFGDDVFVEARAFLDFLNQGTSNEFSFHVVTPKAVATMHPNFLQQNQNYLRPIVILPEVNIETVTNYINKVLDDCHGTSWKTVSLKLTRYFSYEFEEQLMADIGKLSD